MRKYLTKTRIEFLAIVLGVAVIMLAALPVKSDEFRPIRTQHGSSTGAAIATTTAMQSGVQAVRITCVAACYYAFGVTTATAVDVTALQTSGHIAATNATTHFLPANTPVTHRIGEGEFVIIIQVSSGGEFAITELGK